MHRSGKLQQKLITRWTLSKLLVICNGFNFEINLCLASSCCLTIRPLHTAPHTLSMCSAERN